MSIGVERCDALEQVLVVNAKTLQIDVEKVHNEICERAEQLKQEIEREKQDLLTELGMKKNEIVKHADRLMGEFEQHKLRMSNLKQYIEQLRDNGNVVDMAREADKLHTRAKELLIFDDVERTVETLDSIGLTLAPSDKKISQLIGRLVAVAAKTDWTPADKGYVNRIITFLCLVYSALGVKGGSYITSLICVSNLALF